MLHSLLGEVSAELGMSKEIYFPFLPSLSLTIYTTTHKALLHAPSEKFMLFRFIYKLLVPSQYIPTLNPIAFQVSLLTMHQTSGLTINVQNSVQKKDIKMYMVM